MTPRAEFDAYYNTIYSLLLKKISEGNLSNEDIDDLNEIAHDEADSSLANLAAREMFNLCSEYEFPNLVNLSEFEEDFPYTSHLKMQLPEQFDEIKTSIVPENVLLNLGKMGKGILNVFDMSGRLIYSEEKSGEKEIFIFKMNIPFGIYFWRYFDKVTGKEVQSGLILINQ
jgi:hypothetical protein